VNGDEMTVLSDTYRHKIGTGTGTGLHAYNKLWYKLGLHGIGGTKITWDEHGHGWEGLAAMEFWWMSYYGC
jgi:hypothetical protein